MENNIDYLRLSLTDKCNLNCMYCTPLEKNQFLDRNEVLTYEEMTRIVILFAQLGIRKLRLTGGEPLIKRDIIDFVGMLRDTGALEEITMTTNGVYLQDRADKLKRSGLDRINISIDTLKRERFEAITGFDFFDDVWKGVEKALEAGLDPVKLNVVLMKGINDDEIADFAQLTLDRPLIVRFIEFFPTNKRSMKYAGSSLKSDEVKKRITGHFGMLESVSGVKGNGPSDYYKLAGSKGLVGLISSYTENFCNNCNRVRIDCAGRISPCLFSGHTHDMRPILRSGRFDDEALVRMMRDALKIKSRYRKDKLRNGQLEMSSIGG